MTNKNNRATFSGKLGVILATAGSSVGLGNIWRFPYTLGENGGAAFLLIYIFCIFLLGLPVMLSEFYIGRHTHRNAAGAFFSLAPGSKWSIVGYNGVLAAFLILGFYSVIAGWTLEYIYKALSGELIGKSATEFQTDFQTFTTGSFRPIMWTISFILMTHFIIISGVKKGIEGSSKIMMPLLFIIIVIMGLRSVTLDGASEGLKFLFYPDFSKITPGVVLSAMGQAFFSLSVGMGILITYSSYFGKKTNLQQVALQVISIDTIVAILAGIMIFPAVFSFGIKPTAGAELVFITLPNVLIQLPWGSTWAFVFFLLLAVAALTSTISLHEVITAYLSEEMRITRKKASWVVTFLLITLGAISSLSLGRWSTYTIAGMNFFNLIDFVTAKIMLPFGGMMICLFIHFHIKKEDLQKEFTNNGTSRFYYFNTLIFLIRWVSPILIALVFLNQFGLI